MIHPGNRRPRRGYTLTAVLITIMMLFLLWSYATRTTSSLLRIQTKRIHRETRDQGAMNALAQAIQLLEYSTPSDPDIPSRTVFTYGVSISVPSTGTGGGCTTSDYTVTYTAYPSRGPQCWQVQVSPGSYGTPLPSIGANPQWP
jgi:type II secretory pathway pseudopilin PulG